MDFEEFTQAMEAELGGNLVDVELTIPDYSRAFDKAKKTWIQKGNNNLDKRFIALSVLPNQKVYTIPAEYNVDTVVKIIQPKGAFYTDDPFSMAAFNDIFLGLYGGGADMLSFEMSLQFIETIHRYIAHEPQYLWKKRLNQLTLLKSPKKTETWYLETYCDLPNAELYEHLWIQEWTKAELKIILGMAYRKFNSLSAPTGETSLDGATLIQEGTEEKRILLEEIGQYTDGLPTGGPIIIG